MNGIAMKIRIMMKQACPRRGFTLIEMTVVIAIIGMLSVAAVLSLAHTSGRHRFDAMCQQIQQADGLVRSAARQSGNAQKLIFDLDRRQVLWESSEGDSPTRLVAIAGDDSLELQTAETAFSQGQITIDCSPNGYSQSYGLSLGSKNQATRWMVIAGLSGQIIWTNDELEMHTILKSLASRGLAAPQSADAH
jgi:prepilin-type N-terminal cleavage/methylation domain-containing protein